MPRCISKGVPSGELRRGHKQCRDQRGEREGGIGGRKTEQQAGVGGIGGPGGEINVRGTRSENEKASVEARSW